SPDNKRDALLNAPASVAAPAAKATYPVSSARTVILENGVQRQQQGQLVILHEFVDAAEYPHAVGPELNKQNVINPQLLQGGGIWGFFKRFDDVIPRLGAAARRRSPAAGRQEQEHALQPSAFDDVLHFPLDPMG